MKKSLLILLLSCLSFFTLAQQEQRSSPASNYFRHTDAGRTVIVKLKQGVPANALDTILSEESENNPAEIKRAHPMIKKPGMASRSNRKSDDLSSSFGVERIYKLKVNNERDIPQTIQALLQYDFVEYAERYYPVELLYIPNDPFADPYTGNQDNLAVIKAYEAWEVEKGDSTIVIGILDTGVNLDHIDLKNNIYLNEADPINGFDDDGDGYIDNYKGWNFGDDNNDVSDVNSHGTQVAGIAAARTDNKTGMAGVGFKTKFMPIKVFTSEDNTFNDGYSAILYAAQKGCKVINLSWGTANNYSKYVEDIINTVVLDMDVVVVAAAGNSKLNEEYYPASFEYVMSVTNTTKADEKAADATYSPYVDISAPGVGVMTTSGNGYASAYGTSMASPAVAAAAALIRAHYPELSALQIMERLRVTADDVYGVGDNYQYKEHLGKGRLNMLKALLDSTACAVRFREMTYANALGAYAFYDDTVAIKGKFVNYLQEASNLKVTLSVNSPYITLIDSVFSTASLSTLAEEWATFRIYIQPNLPPGERLRFRLGYIGDDYEDYQYFDIKANPDYVTIDNGKLAMTVSSNGNQGYYSDGFKGEVALAYSVDETTETLFDYASLIIGTDPQNVSDNMLNNYSSGIRSKDFKAEKRIKIVQDSPAFIQAVSSFSDQGSANSLGLEIAQYVSSYKETSLNNNLFLDYEITNNSGITKDTLRIGFFADWNIIDSSNNRANYDFNYRMAYAYYPDKNIYAGIALLSAQEVVYQALSLFDEKGDFVFGPQIEDDEKFSLLVKDENRLETGPANIASILTSVIYDFQDQAKANVQFVLTAGRSLEELQENMLEALLRKQPFTVLVPVSFCEGDDIIINPGLGNEVYFYADSLLTQFIGLGNKVALVTAEETFPLYMKQKEGLFYKTYKMIVHIADDIEARFSMDKDSIFFDGSNAGTLVVQDESPCAVRWEWTVNDLVRSHEKEATLMFDAPGNYDIKLKVWNKINKVDSLSKQFTVAYVTGVPQEKTKVLQAFPNPVATVLSINMPLGKEGVISITDGLGNVYAQKTVIPKTQPYLLDVSDLNPGLYILRIETKGENMIKKLIVQ